LKAIKGQERLAKSRLGTYYERLPDKGRSLFSAADGKVAQLVELVVYVADGDAVEWQLDGIVWKSKQ
jgi:hypothetical protein